MTNRIFISAGLTCLFLAPGVALANNDDVDTSREFSIYGLIGTEGTRQLYPQGSDRQDAQFFPVEEEAAKKPQQGKAVPPQGAFPPYLIGVFR